MDPNALALSDSVCVSLCVSSPPPLSLSLSLSVGEATPNNLIITLKGVVVTLH